MNGSKIITAAALAVVAVVATTASARTPRNHSDEDRYAYVTVTGSKLPEKVRIKNIGTLTTSPVRYYDRREIDMTGRFSTEEVLRTDPSVSVHGFGQAGPNN
jgi:hypothetical protein